MKNILLIFIFSSYWTYSQILFNPSSIISCNSNKSFASFTVSNGAPPYNFTVQTPTCANSFTFSIANQNTTFSLSCPGQYSITINDGLNATLGTFIHTVYVSNQIDLPIESELRDTLCIGEVLPLYVTADSTFKYRLTQINWNTGDTGRISLISPTITTAYTFTAILTTDIWLTNPTKTCSASGATTINVRDCKWDLVGLKEVISANTKVFYPNPCYDKIFLSQNMEGASETRLFNSFGEVIFEAKYPVKEIDLSILPTGIYYLEINNSKISKVVKVFKD